MKRTRLFSARGFQASLGYIRPITKSKMHHQTPKRRAEAEMAKPTSSERKLSR